MRRLLILLSLLLASCAAPDGVRQAHEEQGQNLKAIAESYYEALVAAPQSTERDNAIGALQRVFGRAEAEHEVVADYLEAQGLFKDDAERNAFLTTIREVANR